MFLGLILGLVYHLPYPMIKETVETIIKENSAPKSFNIISVFSIVSLGSFIVFAGRTSGQISAIRNIFGYKPIEIALALAAVFFGLLFGFSIAVFELPLLAGGLFAFVLTIGVIFVLLWLSFRSNGPFNELYARIGSGILVLISFGVIWFEYFR